MAKTKTPFLSFGSTGTVGKALTTQKRGSSTLVRSMPIPTDRKTLAQMYQRWDYQDQAYQWSLLTQLQKGAYMTAASPFHMTGFAYWMRVRLTTLPDILARWRLDFITGVLTPDSGKIGYPGTVYGATLTPSIVSNGLFFDGVDDGVYCGNTLDLKGKTAISLEARVKAYSLTNEDRYLAINDYQAILFYTGGKWCALYQTDDDITSATSNYKCAAGQQVHLLGTYDGEYVRLYVDGLFKNSRALTGGIKERSLRTSIGIHGNMVGYPAHAIIDEVVIYTRCLDAVEALRHALRKYP